MGYRFSTLNIDNCQHQERQRNGIENWLWCKTVICRNFDLRRRIARLLPLPAVVPHSVPLISRYYLVAIRRCSVPGISSGQSASDAEDPGAVMAVQAVLFALVEERVVFIIDSPAELFVVKLGHPPLLVYAVKSINAGASDVILRRSRPSESCFGEKEEQSQAVWFQVMFCHVTGS